MVGGAKTSPILVTGGTGTLGPLVVRRLHDAGCNVRVLSRPSHKSRDGIEFVTGEGIKAALDGVETIVHCAGNTKGDEDKARNLVRAASPGGARHLVYGAAELLRGYLRATKRRRRPIVPIWLPGKAARAFRVGANLAPEHAVGRRTWEEFLADRAS